MNSKSSISLIVILICIVPFSYGQNNNYWIKTSKTLTSGKIKSQATEKKEYYRLDFHGLKETTIKANEKSQNKTKSEVIVSFPTSDGQLKQFYISGASVLPPQLSKKYPGIYSFVGKGVDDPSATIRFSLSDYNGVSGVILDNETPTFITPANKGNLNIYKVYHAEGVSKFDCQTSELGKKVEASTKSKSGTLKSMDANLRIYRAAIMCSQTYGDYFAGTGNDQQKIANILAQINTTITHINAFYERDISLRLQLVPDNDKLIFFEGNQGFDPSKSYEENINEKIGFNSYDIGHYLIKKKIRLENDLFSGGVECIGCMCKEGKALARSAAFEPENPIFYTVIAHEMGHQMGAYHVMTSSNCISGNGHSEVEPASGTTIMSYAGICDPQIIPYQQTNFNHVSIWQIFEYMQNHSCGTVLNSGNSAPTANAGPDYTIPKSTPFFLTGQGSDPDGDNVTFTWEQNDIQEFDYDNIWDERQVESSFPSSVKTNGPVFRAYPPSSSPTRYLPNTQDVLNDGPFLYEVLPSISRELNFVLTVRDNHPGAGRCSFDEMTVFVDGNSGPFELTLPVGNSTIQAGSALAVAWNVSGTNTSPVNCHNVKISLSTDGGQSFPYVLRANTPNDGNEAVTVPAGIFSTNCRLKIESINNIFYTVSKGRFSINHSGCVTEIPDSLHFEYLSSANTILAWTRGNNPDYELRYREAGGTWNYQPVLDQPGNYFISETIHNLTPTKTYEAQVRSICNGGVSTIVVRARGTTGQEHINLKVNNNTIGSINLTTTFQNYSFDTNLTGGVTVQFDNDQDNRDVVVDYIVVNGETRQAEAQSYNTAAYANGQCGGGSFTEWMHCNGLIGFGDVNPSSPSSSAWSNIITFMIPPAGYHPGDINTLLKIDQANDAQNNLDWLTNPDPGTWSGVTWNNSSPKRVFDLNLNKKDLTGDLSVTNLAAMETLNASHNNITSIDLNGSSALKSIVLKNTYIKELDLSTQFDLRDLTYDFGLLEKVNFGNIDQLVNIWLTNTHITSMDLHNLHNLELLHLTDNYLKSLDVNNCLELKELNVEYNDLTNLEVSNLPKLNTIKCSGNYLTSLKLNNLPSINTIDASLNELNSITGLNSLTSLKSLKIGHNHFSGLNFSNLKILEDFDANTNELTSLSGLGDLDGIKSFTVTENNLTSLDLADLHTVETVLADSNQLNSIKLPIPSQLVSLNVSDNNLKMLNLINQNSITTLHADINKLNKIIISGLKVPASTIHVTENNLPFSELIKLKDATSLEIDPMNEVFDPVTSATDITIDYSGEAMIEGDATSFAWFKNENLVSINTSGTLTTTGNGEYYCNMFSSHFPGTVLKSAITTIGNSSLCNITVPDPSSLPSFVSSYTHIHVVGSGGPDLGNVTNFNINWSLENNNIYDIAFNTSNGNPDWWVNLMNKVSYTLNTPNPEITISGSGISGLDGSYWVTMDGDNFVLASKSGTYAIYCSNSDMQPCTQLKSAQLTRIPGDIETDNSSVCVYPNPSSGNVSIEFEEPEQYAEITLFDPTGKKVYSKTGVSDKVVQISGLSKGIYFINILCVDAIYNKKLVVE